jgi:hypothetical protein
VAPCARVHIEVDGMQLVKRASGHVARDRERAAGYAASYEVRAINLRIMDKLGYLSVCTLSKKRTSPMTTTDGQAGPLTVLRPRMRPIPSTKSPTTSNSPAT